MNSNIVILADGTFPSHDIPLSYLNNAQKIICCDGSVDNLVLYGLIPDAIVGDMDSLSSDMAERFTDRIFADHNQDTNDLTKAVRWCNDNGYINIVILGATGKREDHTIGNISLLAEYIKVCNPIMVTDTGTFYPFLQGSKIVSFPGQQVSIFSIDPETEISAIGLRYPLERKKISNWWVATLNEAIGDNFSIEFNKGRVIVYMKFEK
jgi:thiamine pyrophosphokinase